jgi:hypothetical protein
MRHGLIAGIAAIAVALCMGALLATWEKGPPNSAGLSRNSPMIEGRHRSCPSQAAAHHTVMAALRG